MKLSFSTPKKGKKLSRNNFPNFVTQTPFSNTDRLDYNNHSSFPFMTLPVLTCQKSACISHTKCTCQSVNVCMYSLINVYSLTRKELSFLVKVILFRKERNFLRIFFFSLDIKTEFGTNIYKANVID